MPITGDHIAGYTTVDTPSGPFSAITAADGAVLASGWTDELDALIPLIHPTLRPTDVRRARLANLTEAVVAYHEGELAVIDTVAVRQVSGPFLTTAWAVLRTVPAGAPVSYAEFAALAGRPAAARGAANACARNAAALFVPCHRVVRTGGALGGFRWGLPVKRWLPAHEA
ncbi:methylated-DNA--[protein]-cysteine S-methyltransferase [Skermania piniformis]|uniref:Methylated-DNA--[protein]-cysteine S-methyltransferase n=1 Tax=Skermania pinensis TaxID=39122 RepID=A0ABX8SCR4_9ACTN|nr:methylated-DNA--[protein]-cysteine S-methyltransferase [Skermania piniformis]